MPLGERRASTCAILHSNFNRSHFPALPRVCVGTSAGMSLKLAVRMRAADGVEGVMYLHGDITPDLETRMFI